MTLDELSHVIPLSVHEDSGPITKRLSAGHVSFASVLADGSGKRTHHLIATHVKETGEGVQTRMWELLLRDFDSLLLGASGGRIVAPAGPGQCWKFLFLFCKCDEEARSN
eukprot:2100802-Pyramimonas_sp.AAC.1